VPCATPLRDTADFTDAWSQTMPKGQQRSNKEAKKPKKGVAPKPASPGSLAAPITTVIPERGKKKK